MKRILLTMLIVLSMLLAVGAASAMTCYINDVQDDQSQYQGYLNAILVTDNTSSPNTIIVALTDETKNYYPNSTITTILLDIPADDIMGVEDSFGNVWSVGDAAGNPFGTFITKTTTNDAELKSTDPIIIYVTISGWDGTLPENDAGNVISIHVQRIGINDEGSAWVTVGDCEDGGGGTTGGDIPEFPTIALPIAAILGLAFFFQRRKE